MNIEKELFKYQDLKYRDFSAKLIPTQPLDYFIGVRLPDIRNLVKQVYKENKFNDFLDTLPHKYHEENMVHVLLISQIKDFEECLKRTKEFLPYINNWAVCDTCIPKCFNKNKDKLFKEIKKWIKSKDTYTIRYAIGLLMGLYLDEDFDIEHLKMVSNVKSSEYYVNMMRAWYFATAMAKQEKATLPILENKVLDDWTHRKTISKCHDSFRITNEMKEYLNSLR